MPCKLHAHGIHASCTSLLYQLFSPESYHRSGRVHTENYRGVGQSPFRRHQGTRKGNAPTIYGPYIVGAFPLRVPWCQFSGCPGVNLADMSVPLCARLPYCHYASQALCGTIHNERRKRYTVPCREKAPLHTTRCGGQQILQISPVDRTSYVRERGLWQSAMRRWRA